MSDDAPLEGDVIMEGEHLDASTAIMAINKSEIDMQISTAKKYPRSLKHFKQNALEMACLDEETAASMFYVLPRGGKKVEGPSARLAEIVGSAFGNLRYGARVVSIDDKFVTAQGACMDLEKNIAANVEVKRRITDSKGRRYNDDMITVTSNAACSIALRQAIFKVVPFALIKPIYTRARETAVGKADSIANKRQRAIDWFVKAGATQQQVLQAIGRAGIEEITIDDLVTLVGLQTAIKDGESTVEEALGPIPDPRSKARTSSLNDKVGAAAPSHDSGSSTPGATAPTSSPVLTSDMEDALSDLRDRIAAHTSISAVRDEKFATVQMYPDHPAFAARAETIAAERIAAIRGGRGDRSTAPPQEAQ